MLKIKIEKLVAGGQGLGRLDSKIFFVWGVLAGEEVEIEVLKSKKNFCEARAVNIVKPSAERIAPAEKHYLSCSPWQIMSWAEELKWKKLIAKENFSRGAKIDLPDLAIEAAEEAQYHYRNKVEYNFVVQENKLRLAMYERRTNELLVIDECCLVRPELNMAANKILNWLNGSADIRNYQKIVLRANSRGEVMADLFVNKGIKGMVCPVLDDQLIGCSFFQALNDEEWLLLGQFGRDYLEEKIDGVTLRYGSAIFFQINALIFQKAVEDIKNFIKKDDEVLDLYSGVGAISLPLATGFKRGILVEESEAASKFAAENIELNKIKNCETVQARAEGSLKLINGEKVLVLDPPRAGLDKSLVERIIDVRPKRLIYLSCDLATQARDAAKFKDKYELKFIKLYNFFPRTPHIESLCVWDRKI